MQKVREYRLIIMIGLICVLVTCIQSNLMSSVASSAISVSFLLVVLVIYCMHDFSRKIGLFLFYICMFTFLGAGAILPFWTGNSNITNRLSVDEYISACNAFSVSCLFLAVGYKIAEKRIRLKIGNVSHKVFISDDAISLERLQKCSYYLFLVSSLVAVIFEMPRMRYALLNGYISLYRGYSVSAISARALIICRTCLFIGLATHPRKKMVYRYILIGCLIPVMNLIEGARSQIVMYVLFVVNYLYNINNYGTKDVHVIRERKKLKKLFLFGIITVVFGIPLLYIWGYLRDGRSFEAAGLWNKVLYFFRDQGGSFRLIGYAVRYKGQLPGISYSFGSIIDRILGNNYAAFTVDAAVKTNSFGAIMTYLTKPYNYLNLNDGVGSSYVAELFYDFGYMGVIMGNLVIGILLEKLTRWETNSVFVQSFYYIFFYYVLTIPRSTLMSPVLQVFSMTNIGTFILLFSLSYRNKGRRLVSEELFYS